MIVGIFHEGSGLGNQLFRYVATRVLAIDKGYKFGMISSHLFKGGSFMNIDMGNPVDMEWSFSFNEKKVVENGIDIRSYDPEIRFVEDYTVVDGEFQDPRYFEHRMKDICTWFQVEPLPIPDDLCVIGFRGGEYYSNPDLGLPKSYFELAIKKMREINAKMRFEIHTDDPALAAQFFPNMPIVENANLSHSLHGNMGYNWRAMRFAKYAIIANSSFYILPRLISHYLNPHYIGKSGSVTIAPRYWARHNTKVWALPQNYYKQFTYIHADDSH